MDKHGKNGQDPNVSVDTTAQKKNITYATDAKLHKKIIDKCVKKARKEGIELRKSYKRTAKQLVGDTYNGHPSQTKEKSRCGKTKTQNYSWAFNKGTGTKAAQRTYAKDLELFKRVLAQEKNGENKIYSLHEPEVYCMSKSQGT